jgi:hypothetical protein
LNAGAAARQVNAQKVNSRPIRAKKVNTQKVNMPPEDGRNRGTHMAQFEIGSRHF